MVFEVRAARADRLEPALASTSISSENENARDFRPWRFPGVLAVNWINTARQPWVGLRVSPLPAPSHAVAGAQSSSFLSARVLWLSPLQVLGSPQAPAPVIASQCVLRLPRLPHLPASPTVNLRVTPNLRPSAPPSCGSPDFPGYLALGLLPAGYFSGRAPKTALRRCRLCVSRFPRLLHPRLGRC